MLTDAVAQVLINMSLALNDALMHIPNFYVFWNLGSIISGAIFYQELSELTSKDIAIFFSGVVVLIIAVTLTNISGARKQRAADEAAAAAEAEKAAALEASARAQSAEGRGEAEAGSVAEAADANPAGVDFLGGGWLEPGGGAQVCMYIHIYTYICIHIYVSIYLPAYICMGVRVCVCVSRRLAEVALLRS